MPLEGEKMGIEKTKNDTTHYLIVFLIIFLLIFLPILIGLVSSNIENTNQSKHEEKLIEEGKVKTHSDVINEIVDILKKRDEEKLKEYLSSDFNYWDDNNTESKYIYKFWSDLKFYTGKHYIEERGDITDTNYKTFWIYWDIPEQLEYKQYSQYSLQKICIDIRKVVKENIITYEINQIILKNN